MSNREHQTGVGKDGSKTPPIRLLLVVLAMLAAGCASDDDGLSGACQVQPCVCAPGGWSPASASKGSPVLWRADGSATCPEGLELQRKKRLPGRQ